MQVHKNQNDERHWSIFLYKAITRGFFIFLLLLLILIPPEIYEKFPETCFYKIRTGRPCPTCGLTRACSAFFHGQFNLALEYNKFVIIAAPLILLLSLWQIFRLIRLHLSKKKKNE